MAGAVFAPWEAVWGCLVVFKAWVHSRSGLVSFFTDELGVLLADGEVIAEVRADAWGSGFWTFSWPFAPVGAQVRYEWRGAGGSKASAVLTRPASESPGGARVANALGRGVDVDLYEDTGDPLSWEPDVSEFENGVVRYRRGKLGGKSRFVLDSPDRFQALRGVLEGPGLVLLMLDAPAASVEPVRCVLVKGVEYERLSTDGDRQIDVEWVLKPYPPGGFVPGVRGRVCPSLTWGDCQAQGRRWGSWTLMGALRESGMP